MFAREGARVVIGDILDEPGMQVQGEINETGGECLYVHLDVTSESDWQNAVEAAVARFGKLDVLVNNAGIGSPRDASGERMTIEALPESQWAQVMDVNAKGVFLGTKAAIPEMRKAGGGSIINISSVAGLVGGTTSAYGASKGAVQLLTKSTAFQLCQRGHPGQLGASGRYHHRHDCRDAGRRGRAPVQPGPPFHRQARRIGRRGLRSPVSGQRRALVRDRQRAGHRRRADGPVASGALSTLWGRICS